jgi:hypothetical protein
VFGVNGPLPTKAAPNVHLNLLQPGNPMLGRTLWGVAAENADGRCRPFYLRGADGEYLTNPDGNPTDPKAEPFQFPAPAQCDRIYVGSFAQKTVTVVELDPASPQDAHYVGEIGNPEWP